MNTPLTAGVPESALQWAVDAVSGRTGRVRIHSVTGLRKAGGPWLLRFEGEAVGLGGSASAVLRVARIDDERQHTGFGIEARALDVATTCQVPAPRLISADLDGTSAGALAVLSTALEGSARIPIEPGPGRLRTFGAAAAVIHQVPALACTGLPRRRRPIELVDYAAARRELGINGLHAEAEAAIAGIAVPDAEPVLVHGDLWQGNVLWSGTRLTGIVDWDCAGTGESGVDLGSARCDAAIIYGPEYIDEVAAGWRDASGREAEDQAYWDVVAALNTPPQMAEFAGPIKDAGRGDLGRPVLIRRRDAFLRTALDRLGRV